MIVDVKRSLSLTIGITQQQFANSPKAFRYTHACNCTCYLEDFFGWGDYDKVHRLFVGQYRSQIAPPKSLSRQARKKGFFEALSESQLAKKLTAKRRCRPGSRLNVDLAPAVFAYVAIYNLVALLTQCHVDCGLNSRTLSRMRPPYSSASWPLVGSGILIRLYTLLLSPFRDNL